MTRKIYLVLLTLVVLAAVLMPQVPSSADGGGGRKGRAVSHRLDRSPREIKQFWTAERMAAARPMPNLVVDPSTTSSRPERGSSVRRIPASDPQGSVSGLTLTRSPRVESQDPPFTRVEVTNVTDYPNVTHGKLFFSVGDSLYVCSGTSVTSAMKNLVATAGHCLYDPSTGQFSSNVLFVPGYRNEVEPFGSWSGETLYVTEEWAFQEDYVHDFALFTTAPNSLGEVEDAIGTRGIIFNQAFSQMFEIFGYPAAPPFDGEKLYKCTTGLSVSDPFGGVETQAVGCDMTQGSSGGGWVIQNQYVNSVMSYGYEGLANWSFGPYLGTVEEALYDIAVVEGDPPVEPGEQVVHQLGLSLRLVKHLRAKGTMTAADGYLPCTRNAPIQIVKMTSRTEGVILKETLTGSEGTYVARLRDKPGKYLAYSPSGYVDDVNLCNEAISALARHRH
ncbi:MAG: trypsin-like serine peptidase [Actinomycetota bacterium]